MPILHTCKACSSKVSDADVQSGRAVRKGSSIYCSECSQLILEPLEAVPNAVAKNQMANSKAPAKAPRLPAPVKVSEAGGGSLVSNLIGPPEDPPTGKQDPLSRNGIEVVEEFEILGGGGDVPDLDKEFGDRNQDGEDEESAIDTNRSSPPARPEDAAGASHRGRRGLKQRMPGGAGSRASARSSGRPGSPRRDRNSRLMNRQKDNRQNEEQAEASRDPKEIFFKSSSRNVKAAAQIEEQHENCVDSNVLRSVQGNQENKRRNARSSASRIKKEPRLEASTSSKQSRRGSMRAPAQGNNTYMIAGGVAALVLLFVLVLAVSGKSKTQPGEKRNISSIEDNQPAGYYAQKARELLDKGDKYAAADMYIRAADAAQRSGDTGEAQRYNQAAYGLKFKTAY